MAEPNEPQDLRPEHDGRIVDADSGKAGDDSSSPVVSTAITPAPPPPPPPAKSKKPEPEPDDPEEEGMVRMSFIEHLEELRIRIIRALMGLGVAFAVCIFFSDAIWDAVRGPAANALKNLGFPEDLAQITPMEGFSIIWVKLPVLAAVFLASPWILYQAWSFISPGLYKKERKLATPFILTTAGLFVTGGLFAYFIAFPFGLQFLLGIGQNKGVRPMVSMTEYTDLFVNVILGIAIVFELPVLIFFLTLLHVASPRFLLRHSRYAILLITIAAAIITPTPDVVNLVIFAAPMVLLYFAGVFASYLLVLSREGKSFPWKWMILSLVGVLLLLAGSLFLAISRFGFHFVHKWPFLVR
jgi:sec-independent protein translocase protein TatC